MVRLSDSADQSPPCPKWPFSCPTFEHSTYSSRRDPIALPMSVSEGLAQRHLNVPHFEAWMCQRYRGKSSYLGSIPTRLRR